jgi:hypothetical protein
MTDTFFWFGAAALEGANTGAPDFSPCLEGPSCDGTLDTRFKVMTVVEVFLARTIFAVLEVELSFRSGDFLRGVASGGEGDTFVGPASPPPTPPTAPGPLPNTTKLDCFGTAVRGGICDSGYFKRPDPTTVSYARNATEGSESEVEGAEVTNLGRIDLRWEKPACCERQRLWSGTGYSTPKGLFTIQTADNGAVASNQFLITEVYNSQCKRKKERGRCK